MCARSPPSSRVLIEREPLCFERLLESRQRPRAHTVDPLEPGDRNVCQLPEIDVPRPDERFCRPAAEPFGEGVGRLVLAAGTFLSPASLTLHRTCENME